MYDATMVDGTVGILAVAWAMVRVVERAVEVNVTAVDLAGAVIGNMVSFCFCFELV